MRPVSELMIVGGPRAEAAKRLWAWDSFFGQRIDFAVRIFLVPPHGEGSRNCLQNLTGAASCPILGAKCSSSGVGLVRRRRFEPEPATACSKDDRAWYGSQRERVGLGLRASVRRPCGGLLPPIRGQRNRLSLAEVPCVSRWGGRPKVTRVREAPQSMHAIVVRY